MAAAINQALGIEPDVVVGKRGEFTVWVDGRLVAQKELADDEIVKAVQAATQ